MLGLRATRRGYSPLEKEYNLPQRIITLSPPIVGPKAAINKRVRQSSTNKNLEPYSTPSPKAG